jgi:integrase
MKKPAKPTPDFPLFAHGNGQWAKKVKGRLRYFGPWDNPQAALARFLGTTSEATNGHQHVALQKKSVSDSPRLVKDRPKKPAKPYPDFPLFPHGTRRWAKKIRGKLHFFGPWRDPHGALRRYLTEKDDWEAGRKPQREKPGVTDALTVAQMVFLYLDAKKLKVESGEMEERTWKEYETYGDRMIRVFGANTLVESLGPADFKRLRADFQKTHKSLASIKGDIRKSKVFFNWAGPGANGQGYLDRLPRFGDAFKPPSQSALEREREEKGERVFSAEQIRAVLAAAGPRLKAMVLLGINCGYGNTDCIKLVIGKLDLDHGWANFARTKNGIKRRNPLWPETVEALRAVMKARKPPNDPQYASRVFITKFGDPYRPVNLSRELGNVMVRAGMGRDEGDFYDLRRTCASIGVQVRDDDAVRTIMGHKRPSTDMLGVYNRLQVSDERLWAVADHIHDWLFKDAGVQSPESGDGQQVAPSEQVA